MSAKSDYYFLNIKQVFPNFNKPTQLENEIWEEVLEPYSRDEILQAVKLYRKNVDSDFAPNPAKFKDYLVLTKPAEPVKPSQPPISLEVYLMEQDIKAGRCVHYFPTYVKGVNYVLDEKLAELYPEEEFKKFSRAKRYHLAVENGLFSDFDEVLEIVYNRNKI